MIPTETSRYFSPLPGCMWRASHKQLGTAGPQGLLIFAVLLSFTQVHHREKGVVRSGQTSTRESMSAYFRIAKVHAISRTQSFDSSSDPF